MVTFDYAAVYDKAFKEVIVKHPSHPILEIGAFKGDSTLHMATLLRNRSSVRDVEFYVVDTWKGTPSEPDLMKAQEVEDLFPTFWKRMQHEGVTRNMFPMQVTSDAAALYFKAMFSFVFIDGDHSYDQVYRDVSNYITKVCRGGVIAGHDYDWGTVRLAVRNAVKEFGEFQIQTFGRCWWIQL